LALYFEDMEIGRRWRTPGRTVTLGELVEFAARYDPQPLHLDAEWAARGPFGGLIASGVHTVALAWSMWVQTGFCGDLNRGGIGYDELRWTVPVRPGDTLRSEVEVVDRAPAPRKGRGWVVMRHTVTNQRGEVVCTFRSIGLVASRAAAGA
jgi:acyl dehydratase